MPLSVGCSQPACSVFVTDRIEKKVHSAQYTVHRLTCLAFVTFVPRAGAFYKKSSRSDTAKI